MQKIKISTKMENLSCVIGQNTRTTDQDQDAIWVEDLQTGDKMWAVSLSSMEEKHGE
jgi:hypothetical protein